MEQITNASMNFKKVVCLVAMLHNTGPNNKAKKLKLGNFYTNDLEKSVKGSDLIIICTPLSTYKNILDKISKHIMPNTILTDVGSTKLNVVKIFSKLKNVKFNILPAHPIAGTEKSGPESGFAELFNKRWCIITPMGKNNKNSLNKLKKLWNIFGSKVQIMNAKNHDKILAITSHMPHLISYAIVFSSLNVNAKEKSQIIKFSAGGFRDFTRIAASDATMWKDIFLNNKKFKTPPVVIIKSDIGMLIYGENKKLEKTIIIAETGKITDNINNQSK